MARVTKDRRRKGKAGADEGSMAMQGAHRGCMVQSAPVAVPACSSSCMASAPWRASSASAAATWAPNNSKPMAPAGCKGVSQTVIPWFE